MVSDASYQNRKVEMFVFEEQHVFEKLDKISLVLFIKRNEFIHIDLHI